MLYPPILDTKLPAFQYPMASQSFVLSIPYKMNRTVGITDIKGFQLLIKTVSTGKEILNISTTTYTDNLASFTIPNRNIFQQNQFYKVQLAYIDKSNNIGYYSQVGVIKCTGAINIEINGLTKNVINNNLYTYQGVYSNADSSEKVYSYYFNIYDDLNNLYETSGMLIHNANLDNELTSSHDSWTPIKQLNSNKNYTIEYGVETINKIKISTDKYIISAGHDIAPPEWCNTKLHAALNRDDGYIELKLTSDTSITGKFILSRSSSKDNFQTWYTITKVNIAKYPNDLVIWKDFTIEQGVEYLYSIRLYNDNDIKTIHMVAEEYKIQADFEDMFLYDGERQLKLRFNPKVSSFKTTRLETKTDTIGGPYPYFFRNGNVAYKEFPISGLISMISDDNELFTKGLRPLDPCRNCTPDSRNSNFADKITWLTADNFIDEREFKLSVLDWLGNGKPKLFRSPGEGNYIVRIMNISMTPNDTLGRMLHTVNGTAYEIMEYNFYNLKDNGYLNVEEVQDYTSYHASIKLNHYQTIQGSVLYNPVTGIITEHNNAPMYNAIISNAIPLSQDFKDANNRICQADSEGTVIMTNPTTSIKISNPLQLELSTLDFDCKMNYIEGVPSWNSWINIVKVEPDGQVVLNQIYRTKLYDPDRRLDLIKYNDATSGYMQWEGKKPAYLVDYLQYLKDTYASLGEVSYLRIYNRKYDNTFTDEGYGKVDRDFYLTAEEQSHINNDIVVKSYSTDASYVVMADGSRVYKNLGVLSELKCGNTFDIDIIFTKKRVKREAN